MTWAFYFGGIGPWELAMIFIVAVALFYKRLPAVGRGLGKGLIQFRKGLGDKSEPGDRPADKPNR